MTEQEHIANFRRANRAMPLSGDAWFVVLFMGGIACLLACGALYNIYSHAAPVLLLAAAPPALMAGFVVFAEKVLGKKPDRTLVLVRVYETESA